jgi:hypothetical protein
MKRSSVLYPVILIAVILFGFMTSCQKSGESSTVNPEVVDSLKVGLIAYYPFNNSGVDESGNGNHGNVYNITSVPDRNGKANYAYHFDGATSYIRVPDNQPLRLNNTDYTVNTWVKLDSYGPTYGSIAVCKRGTGNSNGWNYGIHGYIGSNSAILGQTTMQISGGLDPTASGVKVINLGTWYMLTTVYSLSKHQVTFYVNGVIDTVISDIPSPSASATSDMYIGSDNLNIGTSGYFFKGALDDMRIYGRVLSPAQIQKLYTTIY